MTTEHEMRPECAERLGAIEVRIKTLSSDDRDRRNDMKELGQLITANREAVLEAFRDLREDVVTLKERARNWGMLGGVITSLLVTLVAGVVLAAVL